MKPCPTCNHPIFDNATYCGCGWRQYRDIEAIEREMYGQGDNPVVTEIRARLREVPLGKKSIFVDGREVLKAFMREPGEDEAA